MNRSSRPTTSLYDLEIANMEHNSVSRWDIAYEWKAVALLSLGFGLVGIDRFMIMPLFPVMMTDLHLDYQDLGHITGALAVAWGISAMFMGNLSDRVGHRKVIIPAIIVFSLLAGLSGLATGVGSLDPDSRRDGLCRRRVHACEHYRDPRCIEADASRSQYRHSADGAAAVWSGHRADPRHAVAKSAAVALDIRGGVDSGFAGGLPDVQGAAQYASFVRCTAHGDARCRHPQVDRCLSLSQHSR